MSTAFTTRSSSKHLVFMGKTAVLCPFCPENVFGDSSLKEPGTPIPRDIKGAAVEQRELPTQESARYSRARTAE